MSQMGTLLCALHLLVGAAVAHLAPTRQLRAPTRRASLYASSGPEPRDPPVRSILDLEPFQRVREASEVVAVAAARSRGRGKEANDVLIRELIEASSMDAAIQLHYDWVSSLKFLRGVQVRMEDCAPIDPRRARLADLMARIRAEMQVRMDCAQRLVGAELSSLSSDPLAMRALARRGLLDEALIMMLVAYATCADKNARALETPAGGALDDGSAARLAALLQRLVQDAMRELDLAVAPEFLVLRRLLQTRAPAARAELAVRACAGDRLVSDLTVDLSELLSVVREFMRIEAACEPPDNDAQAKLAVVERELSSLARGAASEQAGRD
jgi:hypothetical protein